MNYESEILHMKTYADGSSGASLQVKYKNSETVPIIINNNVNTSIIQ